MKKVKSVATEERRREQHPKSRININKVDMVLNLRSDRSRSSFGPKSKLSKDNFQAMINLNEANNSPPLMSNQSLSGQKGQMSKTPQRNHVPIM